jgi:Ni/Co efflux regulator RcnB
MKKVVLLIMAALMMSAVANADTTDRGKKHKKKKHKTHQSSQHSWKSVSTGRTCNKKRRH